MQQTENRKRGGRGQAELEPSPELRPPRLLRAAISGATFDGRRCGETIPHDGDADSGSAKLVEELNTPKGTGAPGSTHAE